MTLEEISDNYRIKYNYHLTRVSIRHYKRIEFISKKTYPTTNLNHLTRNYRDYIFLKRLRKNGYNGRESSFLYDISTKDLRKYDFRAYRKYNLYNSLDNFEYNDTYLNDYSKPEFSLHSLHWNDVGAVTINKAEPVNYIVNYEPVRYINHY